MVYIVRAQPVIPPLPPPLPPRSSPRAFQVKICTGGSTSDCVTSRADSYPVVNLREGITMLSHIDGTTPCNTGCVNRFWEGPENRLFQLRTTDG